MSQDFTGLSELLLGQAQPKQFQSYNDEEPLGWWWGSKVSDDGNYTALDSVINNANAEIPRSYNSNKIADPIGNYYNFYAASAESGKYANRSVVVKDSICPAGWKLPTTWVDLIHEYDYIVDHSAYLSSGLPLSVIIAGEVSTGTGDIDFGGYAYIWSSTVVSGNAAGPYGGLAARHFNAGSKYRGYGRLFPENYYSSGSSGMSLRCVLRDSE